MEDRDDFVVLLIKGIIIKMRSYRLAARLNDSAYHKVLKI